MRHVVHVVAWADLEPVGLGFAGIWPGGETYPRLEADIGVSATHRRRGIGSALLRALSDHARDLGHTGFQFEVSEDREDALSFLLRHGYAEVGRELQFVLDLTRGTTPSMDPPKGVEIVSRAERPDLIPGMYEVAVDAARDIPGAEGDGVGGFDDWRAFEIERPSSHPENCFIAVAGEDVVAFATLQSFGGETAYHGGTLVKRAWRRRGIARALTLRQIAAAKVADIRFLHCETEARNEPMRRLLEQLGYRPQPSVIVLHGPLAHERRIES